MQCGLAMRYINPAGRSGTLGTASARRIIFYFPYIGGRRHAGTLFENFAEIVGVIAAAYQFSNVLDFFFIIPCKDFLCFLDSQIHQIT